MFSTATAFEKVEMCLREPGQRELSKLCKLHLKQGQGLPSVSGIISGRSGGSAGHAGYRGGYSAGCGFLWV
ncbi:hypothetical protein ANANG_G00310640 [Anguilla anguilla]|uniref:Uncharacterized protein n=1 Tax=Anguilla anguilla TaxID=7936 RepID=A0A9D3LJB0_ANGAN|nr:hypothetical protein ANANG_G00310640 [Anguilla anguilla]